MQEPEWAPAVQLLDEQDKAGWAFFEQLFSGKRSASELINCTFCVSG